MKPWQTNYVNVFRHSRICSEHNSWNFFWQWQWQVHRKEPTEQKKPLCSEAYKINRIAWFVYPWLGKDTHPLIHINYFTFKANINTVMNTELCTDNWEKVLRNNRFLTWLLKMGRMDGNVLCLKKTTQNETWKELREKNHDIKTMKPNGE